MLAMISGAATHSAERVRSAASRSRIVCFARGCARARPAGVALTAATRSEDAVGFMLLWQHLRIALIQQRDGFALTIDPNFAERIIGEKRRAIGEDEQAGALAG